MRHNFQKRALGMVSLVGAGPGDTQLLTLKALDRIQQADLIVYDTLANPEHLSHAKITTKKICVGKGFRHRLLSQQKINRLIIRASKNNQKVVRLKGGDPYLFGRGGEEALVLKKQGIPFEVIPGVTSATGCAAYVGIPLTHREESSSVTFITGHKADDETLDSMEWKKIAALGGTIVIYMGFYNLDIIARQLLKAGMPRQTKIAVITWGTLPRQKSSTGTLSNIEKRAAEAGLAAPCIILVGSVVSLQRKLNWFEKLPLFGKKILITRTHDKAGVLRRELSDLGAEVMDFPTIEIRPPARFLAMDLAINNIRRYHWMVFASSYGVNAFFDRLLNHHHRDARFLDSLKIACVGPETSLALRQRGVMTDLIPERFHTLAIVDEFKKRGLLVRDKNFLLIRADIAPPELEQHLKKLGAHVHSVTGYRTRVPARVSAEVKTRLLNGGVDIVTFTSSSTVTHFVKLLGLKNARRVYRLSKFVSIGPVTSRTLRRYGFKPFRQARVFDIRGLIEAIKKP